MIDKNFSKELKKKLKTLSNNVYKQAIKTEKYDLEHYNNKGSGYWFEKGTHIGIDIALNEISKLLRKYNKKI